MTKFFYNETIPALYMAEKFGVKYQTTREAGPILLDIRPSAYDGKFYVTTQGTYRGINWKLAPVSPESEHRSGDVGCPAT